MVEIVFAEPIGYIPGMTEWREPTCGTHRENSVYKAVYGIIGDRVFNLWENT